MCLQPQSLLKRAPGLKPKWDLDCSQKQLPIKLQNLNGGARIFAFVLNSNGNGGAELHLHSAGGST